MMADVPGPEYQWAEEDIKWGPVSLNTFLHSGGRGDPAAPRSRGDLHALPVSLYVAWAAMGIDLIGPGRVWLSLTPAP